ncbi:hypothetical protein JOC75_000751 [Metabacillus crassostreae]|uniref:hypothetical protein n=1 Tax=Metabacillus crassostreae TaxID=929098 RepID=UPI001956F940|nr:hypothetical protein [Metabacillus crassostreae]MBM7602781.1 hypothetical protein [Metabacillus crassostreae]
MKYVYLIISLVFILIFDLWVENSNQAQLFYENWLEPFIDERKISIIWLLLPLVFFVILFRFALNKKEEEIIDLRAKLESEMEILVYANTELSSYRLQDNLSKLLDQFVKRHPYVIAVQLYHFSEQNLNRNTIFKLNFVDGTVVEDVNINAIHQLYYKSRTRFVREFRDAKKMLLEEDDPNALLNFIIDTYSMLSEKSRSSMNEEDACLCSLMVLGLEILERDYQLGIESLGNGEEKFDSLLNDYRTGLLRGALMNDSLYTFTHTRDNEKLNRQYLTRLVKVRNEETLFLIALDSSVLDDREYDNIMVSIGKGFESLLIDLEKVYNRTIEKVGDSNGN